MILGKFTKQYREISDYDIDLSKWLHTDEGVTMSTATIECLSDVSNTALIVVSVDASPSAVRVKLSHGTPDEHYKITVLTTAVTTGGSTRVAESEFIVKVREY